MTWPDRIRGQLAEVVAEDRWRAPKEFDARGPAGALERARPSCPLPPTTTSV